MGFLLERSVQCDKCGFKSPRWNAKNTDEFDDGLILGSMGWTNTKYDRVYLECPKCCGKPNPYPELEQDKPPSEVVRQMLAMKWNKESMYVGGTLRDQFVSDTMGVVDVLRDMEERQ